MKFRTGDFNVEERRYGLPSKKETGALLEAASSAAGIVQGGGGVGPALGRDELKSVSPEDMKPATLFRISRARSICLTGWLCQQATSINSKPRAAKRSAPKLKRHVYLIYGDDY